jgi:integrase
MSDQPGEVLRAFHIQRKKEALQEGKGAVAPFIFHDKNGQPLSQNTVRSVFKWTLGKAGLRNIRIHDIRHTFASLLLSDGASPVYVKEQLGHSSIQMTVDIYGHLIPNSNRKVINGLDTQQSATQPQPTQKQKA